MTCPTSHQPPAQKTIKLILGCQTDADWQHLLHFAEAADWTKRPQHGNWPWEYFVPRALQEARAELPEEFKVVVYLVAEEGTTWRG